MVLSAFPATALHGPWDAGPEGALCPTPASPMQPAPHLPLAWACAAACLRPISTAKLFLPGAGQAGCFLSCRQSWFWQEEGGAGEAQETSSRAAWEPALGVMTPCGGKVLPHLFLVIGHIAGHAASDSVPRRSSPPPPPCAWPSRSVHIWTHSPWRTLLQGSGPSSRGGAAGCEL